jgi:intracellular sulfur oxidation DsrE/DsrF family protein
MKKVLSLVAVASLAIAVVACGPSKAELEKKAKATADSIAEVAKQDSIAKAAEAAATAAKMQADSLAQVAKADSLKKVEEEAATKGGKKGGKK